MRYCWRIFFWSCLRLVNEVLVANFFLELLEDGHGDTGGEFSSGGG